MVFLESSRSLFNSNFTRLSVSLHWHIFGDDKSLNLAQKSLDRGFSSLPFDRRQQFASKIQLYNLDEVDAQIGTNVDVLMKYFTGIFAVHC